MNHTDLTMQYRETSAAAGLDTPSFLRSGNAQITHRSIGGLGNTSAVTERYNAYTMRAAYGITPDEYDDGKVRFLDESLLKANSRTEGSNDARGRGRSNFHGDLNDSGSDHNYDKDKNEDKSNGRDNDKATSTTNKNFFGQNFLFGADNKKSVERENESGVPVAKHKTFFGTFNSASNESRIDNALEALELDLPPPPPSTLGGIRDRAVSTSSTTNLGDISSTVGSSSPTHAHAGHHRHQHQHHHHHHHNGNNSPDYNIKRKHGVMISRTTISNLQQKLDLRVDKKILEKMNILHKKVKIQVGVRMPTNHLFCLTLEDCYSDETLHDLFNKASLEGDLRWKGETDGKTHGLAERDYFFAYFDSSNAWTAQSEGGIGFLLGGYSPLKVSERHGNTIIN